MRTESQELVAANEHARQCEELLHKHAPTLLEQARSLALSAAGDFAKAYYVASDPTDYAATLGDDERACLNREIAQGALSPRARARTTRG